jgi:hypothetical protein
MAWKPYNNKALSYPWQKLLGEVFKSYAKQAGSKWLNICLLKNNWLCKNLSLAPADF